MADHTSMISQVSSWGAAVTGKMLPSLASYQWVRF